LDYLILPDAVAFDPARAGCPDAPRAAIEEAGRSRRGLSLGLTPLVSEPSWPPLPDQAWLRIAVPEASRRGHEARRARASPSARQVQNSSGLGFPQFTRFAAGGHPPMPPFLMSPLLCR
jgi:hypothetical protein